MAAAEPAGGAGDSGGGPGDRPERPWERGLRPGAGRSSQLGDGKWAGGAPGNHSFHWGLGGCEVPYPELRRAAGPSTTAPPHGALPGSGGSQGSSCGLPAGRGRLSHCRWVAPKGCGHSQGVRGGWTGSQERPQVSLAYLAGPSAAAWPASTPRAPSGPPPCPLTRPHGTAVSSAGVPSPCPCHGGIIPLSG